MDAFVSPLHELGSFEELERASAEEGTVLSATGCMDAQKPQKETIDLLGKIITNILTALYEPFGFSLLLSFLAPKKQK